MSAMLAALGGVLGSVFGDSNGGAFKKAIDGFEAGVGGALGQAVGGLSVGRSDPKFDGLRSATQGSNPPPAGAPDEGAVDKASSQAKALVTDMAGQIIQNTAMSGIESASTKLVEKAFGDPLVRNAKRQGRAQRASLDSAFPEANVWDKMGASSAGSAGAGQASEMSALDKKLANDRAIAGLNAATSRANNYEQTRAQNAMLQGNIQRQQADLKQMQAQLKLTNQQASNMALEAGVISAREANLWAQTGLIPVQGANYLSQIVDRHNDGPPVTNVTVNQDNDQSNSSSPGRSTGRNPNHPSNPNHPDHGLYKKNLSDAKAGRRAKRKQGAGSSLSYEPDEMDDASQNAINFLKALQDFD